LPVQFGWRTLTDQARRLGRRRPPRLPNIFPELGQSMRFTLFADFASGLTNPGPNAWSDECDLIIAHGLAGVADRLIRERSIDVPASVVEKFRNARFYDTAATTMVVCQSKTGIDGLRERGIPFVITKGPGIARSNRHASERPYVDLDVVVEPSRFVEARAILVGMGFSEQPRTRPTRDSFNRLCREAINLRADGGASIDLHHRVSPWYWSSGVRTEALLRRAEPTVVFGTDLPLVAPADNLLVAVLHLVSDRSRPGQTYRIWRDILVLLRTIPSEDVIESAARAGLVDWMAWIIGCLPADVRPVDLLTELRARPSDLRGRFRLRMLLPPHRGSHPLLSNVFRLPILNATWFVIGMLLPSPSYLKFRYPDAGGRYVRWWLASVRGVDSTDHLDPSTHPLASGGQPLP
jgi:hypothetical protein